MKLRIQGNSVRLRVSRSELSQLQAVGRVDDAMHVSPDARLDYRLEVADVETLTARLAAASLSITLPRRLAEPWYADGEVSVEGEQLCGDGRRLNILVEKDFACLIPREGEDQSDLFSNPAQA